MKQNNSRPSPRRGLRNSGGPIHTTPLTPHLLLFTKKTKTMTAPILNFPRKSYTKFIFLFIEINILEKNGESSRVA